MLFNSFQFVLFAAAFFAAWPLMRRRKNTRWAYLVAASFFFYGWWDWRFLFLIVGSGLIDYFAALGMSRWPRWRKALLVASIFGNVGSLAVFKYLDFLIGNVNWLSGIFGGGWRLPMAELILPVGISFYTFQSMSYTFDVYRRRLAPTHNVLHFFAYLSMFPQLVAGPIVRAARLLPQLEKHHTTTEAERWEGTQLILMGLFKKMVVADNIAPAVDAAFSAAVPAASTGYWWVVMILFSYQLYCDFSGYSDIARGLGRWMGYDFPVNFNHPYISGSFRELWGRWHISLSTWFRDYLYVPVARRYRSSTGLMSAVWITMLVSGLWHGSGWTFIIWGAMHAVFLTIEQLARWPERCGSIPVVGRHVATLWVYLAWTVACVFFRAESLDQATTVFTTMFSFTGADNRALRDLWRYCPIAVAATALMILRQLWFHFRLDSPCRRARRRKLLAAVLARPGRGEVDFGTLRLMKAKVEEVSARLNAVAWPVAMALLAAACVFLRGPGKAFIYFQF